MDMLNQLQRLVSGDDPEVADTVLKRDIQAAFPTRDTVTPANLLLERLMARAEATPQLAVVGAEAPLVAFQPLPEPVATVAQRRGWWSRFLNYTRRAPAAPLDVNWEVYHEHVEYYLRQANIKSL